MAIDLIELLKNDIEEKNNGIKWMLWLSNNINRYMQ